MSAEAILPARPQRRPLENTIIEAIQQGGGLLPFSRFMELALYAQPSPHKVGGYYTEGKVLFGPGGDYFTSPDLHSPYFGRGLARVLVSCWKEMGCPEPFTVVEMGAGNGVMGRDILLTLREEAPPLFTHLDYVFLDISPSLLARQRQTLDGLPAHYLLGSACPLPLRGVTGCFLSNELVDAFPVHRVLLTSQGLQEVFIGYEDSDFFEELGPPSEPRLAEYVAKMDIQMEEEREFCVSLMALQWLEGAAQSLERGFVLTFDYGYMDRRALTQDGRPPRFYGPRHRVGGFDITADVDFLALRDHGEALGLETVTLSDEVDYTAGFAPYPIGPGGNSQQARLVLLQSKL